MEPQRPQARVVRREVRAVGAGDGQSNAVALHEAEGCRQLEPTPASVTIEFIAYSRCTRCCLQRSDFSNRP